ncbi:isopeptide-forming domain-containing fimbrial protein [Lactiplantibacillus plantarum]|uniref:isopeptide-forming domain-containing fimbrial protein n=1 Tax=Lactiplantibacillus plantarum TaxID=1590 RepID=UPI000FF497B1|nr:isopeptide-forming domain-containing fimbrial protein [Lactiplantibacillus plantarum]RWZ42587.1 isopeptide-forming domain-containing fimbrial protein [Lactiplantibacillus plantarum]
MNPKITAEVKLYGKKMLVLSALTLTIAPLVAVGNQRGMTARADSTGNGSQTNGLKVKVDDKALQTAVTQAKAAGVNVTQKATKNSVATSGQATQAQKDIATDYNTQATALAKVTATQKATMDKYNTAEAQYKKDLAAWEAYMKDPEYTNSTQWSKQTLQDLIGNNPANVTYVSNSTNKMKLDYGNVSKMTAVQFKTFLETYKGGSTTSSVDNKNGTWVVLKVGSTFTYQSPFVDVSTGKPVDVKFTVDKLDNQKTPAYAYLSKYAMGANLATPNLYGHYKVNFYDHDSGKPVTLKEALIGMGDLDASQYVKFDGQAVKTIYGDKVTKVNDDSYKAHDDTAYDDAETGTQVWRRLDNVSGFSYTWGQAIDHWSVPYQSDDYFAVGNIDFSIKLKPKPVAPTKPKAETASYQLTDLMVTPSNHKDVTAGNNQGKDTASINGKTVDKGDTLTYPLTNSDLPANRTDDIKSYVLTDKVQKELTVNQAETVKANTKNWDVKVDGQTVTYTAKADLLKTMNADKSKAYAVPEAKLVTTVNADNVTVKNNFTTKINDVTTDSNTPSNPVEKLSPSLVAKRVEDAQGKLATTSDNVNILTGKDVYFDIFNQYDNNSHTDDLTDTDQLPKAAKVDTSKIKVMMSDGKADAFSMTADKLTGLSYTKDMTSDVTIAYKDGKLTVTPKAGKEAEFKNQQTKVRFAASLPKEKADSQLTKKDGDYVWHNKVAKGDQTSNNVDYNAEKDPDLITKKVETKDGKLADNVANANIINAKTVTFNIFNQYNNLGETQYMTDTDQLPKDAKVDLKAVKVYLADTTTADTNSSSKADDQSSTEMSASSSAKTDDQSTSKTSKIDAKTMTKEKLATLTYTKDVTADFTVKFENGKLTVTPKADKIAEYAGKQTKTRFVASLPTDKVDSELTKQGQTYTWNNQASNGKDKTSTVKYHTDKPSTPAKPTTPAPKPTVTKVVKMAQTGHHQTWFDRLVAWFK